MNATSSNTARAAPCGCRPKTAVMLLALLGLATLWMAVAADMGASLLVITNALRLLRPAP